MRHLSRRGPRCDFHPVWALLLLLPLCSQNSRSVSGLSRDDQIAEQGVSLNRYEYRQYAPVTWIVLRPTLETICSDHVGGFGSLERVLDFVIFRVFRILAFPRCCHVLAKNSSRFNYNKRTTIVTMSRRRSSCSTVVDNYCLELLF